jgi:hypothetical protein
MRARRCRLFPFDARRQAVRCVLPHRRFEKGVSDRCASGEAERIAGA